MHSVPRDVTLPSLDIGRTASISARALSRCRRRLWLALCSRLSHPASVCQGASPIVSARCLRRSVRRSVRSVGPIILNYTWSGAAYGLARGAGWVLENTLFRPRQRGRGRAGRPVRQHARRHSAPALYAAHRQQRVRQPRKQPLLAVWLPRPGAVQPRLNPVALPQSQLSSGQSRRSLPPHCSVQNLGLEAQTADARPQHAKAVEHLDTLGGPGLRGTERRFKLCQRKPLFPFSRDPFFWDPLFSFFVF